MWTKRGGTDYQGRAFSVNSNAHRQQIVENRGAGLFSVHGSLGQALQFAFPEGSWDLTKFSNRGKRSQQRWLGILLKKLLPEGTTILENFLHPELEWGNLSFFLS